MDGLYFPESKFRGTLVLKTLLLIHQALCFTVQKELAGGGVRDWVTGLNTGLGSKQGVSCSQRTV